MANVFNEVGNQLIGNFSSSILYFTLLMFVIVALAATMWYFLVSRRKFNIKVKVTSERANDKDSIFFDKAAILLDRKTNSYYFRLFALKKDLPVPPFNVLQKTDKGDYLEIKRTTENKFYFLTPPQISKKYFVKKDGKSYLFSNQMTKLIDPDIEFWMAKRKQQNKSMFDPDRPWMKLLVYMPQILSMAIMIFVLYILMSYLPEVLSELKFLAQELNRGRTAEITTGLIWAMIR